MFYHLHCHILITIHSQKLKYLSSNINYVSNTRPMETAAQRRRQSDDLVPLCKFLLFIHCKNLIVRK